LKYHFTCRLIQDFGTKAMLHGILEYLSGSRPSPGLRFAPLFSIVILYFYIFRLSPGYGSVGQVPVSDGSFRQWVFN